MHLEKQVIEVTRLALEPRARHLAGFSSVGIIGKQKFMHCLLDNNYQLAVVWL